MTEVHTGAADGYARAKGIPAATLLHLGRGLANGLANFHNARKARVPVVSIVGDHSTSHPRYDAPLSASVENSARTVSDRIRIAKSGHELGAEMAVVIADAVQPPGQGATLSVPALVRFSRLHGSFLNLREAGRYPKDRWVHCDRVVGGDPSGEFEQRGVRLIRVSILGRRGV